MYKEEREGYIVLIGWQIEEPQDSYALAIEESTVGNKTGCKSPGK